MIEIALHLLDIVQNSIMANAKNIKISVYENTSENILSLEVEDDGNGMDEETLKRAKSPFYTTNDVKRIGLGISLLKTACENAEGSFYITSKKGEGTHIKADFKYDSVNRQPLGDMATTVSNLLMCNRNVGFIYKHTYNGNYFIFDSDEYSPIATEVVKRGENVLQWLIDTLNEKINTIYSK
ncbi:MAG: sensor histidine kinase [Ruminococcaceae bacterium]|nr:sensor histidine kinase [Oscillospiraceae bacterium]